MVEPFMGIKIVNSFAAQRGIKIVRYNPIYHDAYLKTARGIRIMKRCHGRNAISNDYREDLFNKFRIRRGVEEVEIEFPNPRPVGLQIYLATTMRAGDLDIIGYVIWSRLERVKSQVDEMKQLFYDTEKDYDEKMPDIDFKKTYGLQTISFPENVPMNIKNGDIKIVCSAANGKKEKDIPKGIGRLLFAYAIARMQRIYRGIFMENIKGTKLIKIGESFGFDKAVGSITGKEADGLEYEMKIDRRFSYLPEDKFRTNADYLFFLNGNRRKLGTVSCSRSGKTGYAPNGAKYLNPTDDMWDAYCKNGNKGFTNPYAGNSKIRPKQRKTFEQQIIFKEEQKRLDEETDED